MTDDPLAMLTHFSPGAERTATARLSRYPWLWPTDPDEAEWVRGRLRLEQRPRLAPGQVLLISVDAHKKGALWSLSLASQDLPRGVLSVPIRSHEAWKGAIAKTHGALPLLWQTLRLPDAPPNAVPVACEASRPTTIDGFSFALSFLLAHASLLLEAPISVHVAASATISSEGSVGRVEGLEHKIRTLARFAPQVTRLLVAKAQEEEANRLAAGLGGALRIVGVATADEAVEHAFRGAEDAADALVRALRETPSGDRERRIRCVYRLALADKHATPRWQAVQLAAQVMSEWTPLEPNLLRNVELARAIAARHCGDLLPLELPDEDEVGCWPQPERADRLAHLLQHAADTGQPDPETLLRWTAGLPSGPDAFPSHLRLHGARGRLLARLGRPEAAIAAQRSAAEGWLQRPDHDGLTFPLAELFRLAAAEGDPQLLEGAEELFGSGQSLLSPFGRSYVELQRARARITVARADAEQVRDAIAALLRLADLPQHGDAARRWLSWARRHDLPWPESAAGARPRWTCEEVMRGLAEQCAKKEAEARSARLAQRLHCEEIVRTARTQLALIRLDLALEGDDRDAAGRAVLELEAVQGPLVALLRDHRPAGEELSGYLQRAFPY